MINLANTSPAGFKGMRLIVVDFDIDTQGESYFVKHWHGHHSLAKSFWVNLIGINLVILIIQIVLEMVIARSSLAGLGVALRVSTFMTAFLIWLWGAVGVWRSADRYTKRPGSGIWGNVASAIVVFQGVSWLVQAPNALP